MRLRLFVLASLLALPYLASQPVMADSVVTTVGVGASPSVIAVNPVTNKIYVAFTNSVVTGVRVINGLDNSFASNVLLGPGPISIARNLVNKISVDSVTNKIYVAVADGKNSGTSSSVAVINGLDNSTSY